MKLLTFALLSILSFFVSGQNKTAENEVFDVARTGTLQEIQNLEEKYPEVINSVNEAGYTPLILACYRGNLPVAEYLIAKVDDIDYVSPSGTALAAAVVKGNLDLVRKLFENHANPNVADSNGTTPLIFAIRFQNQEMIELLLKFNADKNLADKTGITPFEHAMKTENPKIIELLKN